MTKSSQENLKEDMSLRKNVIPLLSIFWRSYSSLLLVLSLLIITACNPSSEPKSKGRASTRSNSSSTSGNGTSATGGTGIINTSPLYWYSQLISTGTLTVTSNTSLGIYIRGSDVELFLKNTTNFAKTYCVGINFSLSTAGAKKQLRARAVPVAVNNLSNGQIERMFRVDINDQDANSQMCLGTANYTIGATSYSITAAQSAFAPNTICTSCYNIITADNLVLFTTTGTTITSAVPWSGTNALNTQGLGFRVDLNNYSNNPSSTCTNSGCISQGYDCCLNGQCINDGEVKPTASGAEFSTAQTEVSQNPLAYLNYPQYYYICPGNAVPTPTATATPNYVDQANQNFLALKNDYFCIKELEANASSQPFHTNPVNNSATYVKCKVSPVDSAHTLYYQTVMNRLYSMCGCTKTTFADRVAYCPNYTLVATALDSLGQPTVIECQTPNPSPTPTPFQVLDINVNSRSAPHRFFSSTGTETEQLTSLVGSTTLQEGTEFYYQDAEKILPVNGSFNMNSVLGQMAVSLDQALPAKVVNVEYDQSYIITVASGFYTPCSQCAKDSWFPLFSPHPSSQMGFGLRAIGYSTSRESFESNASYGNYEDTIWGRACFVPPTMLPFSHYEKNTGGSYYSSAQNQRLARLKTQAAMFVNGYQRDWFGFNQGALIASFDGVTWFAVGSNRLAKATSTKLYLAINAPFADLADPTIHVVHIEAYDGVSTVSEHDYDPSYSENDSRQNQAASCQQYHYCNYDSDCITKLGWEYMCADVTQYKTKWPNFDPTGAKEKFGGSTGSLSKRFNEILLNTSLPGGTKRCVYRGAGSPCRTDNYSITDVEQRRLFSCAPNFYCEKASTSSAFNDQVARFATQLESLPIPRNHFFGRDAKHLGRPLNYLGGMSATTGLAGSNISLTTDIQANLAANASLNSNSSTNPNFNSSNVGLCRPAKKIDTATVYSQHQNKDTSSRTDFISQIGSCTSDKYHHKDDTTDLTNTARSRYYGCPILDSNGDHVFMNLSTYSTSTTLASSTYIKEMRMQNACGYEAKYVGSVSSSNTNRGNNLFSLLEKAALTSSSYTSSPIIDRALAQDACLRRAGSVCHSDLDCSPNSLHADVALNWGTTQIGNNAELKYWQENLICGQAADKPLIGQSSSSTYDISLNRCCRQIAKDFTMYTEMLGIQSNLTAGPDAYYTNTKDFVYTHWSAFPFISSNITVPFTSSSTYGANSDTEKYSRAYSRYSIIKDLAVPSASPNSTPWYGQVKTDLASGSQGSTTNNQPFQWKTMNETGQKTCCGGGWIRKFADGSHDWTVRDRLNFDVENFKCLNYKNPNQFYRPPYLSSFPSVWSRDYSELCQGPDKGCIQSPIGESTNSSSVNYPQLAKYFDANDNNPLYTYNGGLGASNGNGFGTVTLTIDPKDIWNLSNFTNGFSPSVLESTMTTNSGVPVANRNLYWDKPGTDLAFLSFPSFIPMPSASVINTYSYAPGDATNPIAVGGTCGTCPIYGTDSMNQASGCRCYLSTNGNSNPFYFTLEVKSYAYPTSGSSSPVECTNMKWGVYRDSSSPPFLYVDHDSTGGGGPGECVDGTINNLKKIVIKYTPVGSPWYFYETTAATSTSGNSHLVPGNEMYYLNKLERFELTGIPQIQYEPIYCTHDRSQIMPGLFMGINDSLNPNVANNNDRQNFQTMSYVNSNISSSDVIDQRATYFRSPRTGAPNLKVDQIFSENEFTCCKKLGTKANSANECCSNFRSTANLCVLPEGTDLNVYFNKFVSSEGVGANVIPGGGLKDSSDGSTSSDFDPYTGYPKDNSTVKSKLLMLGQIYCRFGKVRLGGAFGTFYGEPIPAEYFTQDPYIYSIVDSITDEEQQGTGQYTAGHAAFKSGFRWNNHYYCADDN